jgi:hypothetical protein
MATCDGERFLHAQLASIVAQTRRPAEVVVVDDASSDATRSILAAFCTETDVPVRVFENSTRLGPTKTFERAITLCTGDVIALADQDDRWHPDKLSVLCEELAGPSGALLVFSDARLVDDGGAPLGRTLWAALGLDAGLLDRLGSRRALGALLAHNQVTGASAAFRSRLRELAVPFPSHLPYHIHDGWLAALAAVLGRLRPARHVLMDYRVHPDQHIGVPEEQSVAPGSLVDRSRTVPDFSRHLVVAGAIRDRLASVPPEVLGDDASARSTVDDLLRYLQVRSALPPRLVPRTLAVGHELARGGYHRWASGTLTAVKDMASVATLPA